MPNGDDAIPGEVQLEITPEMSKQSQEQSQEEVEAAIKEEVAAINSLTESEKDPGYISGDESSPGKKPD